MSIAIGFGYIFLMLNAFSLNPKKKYYNRLFNRSHYLVHLTLGVILAIFGLYRIKYVDLGEVGYLMPLFFLIVFRLLDDIILKKEGRHILVVTRGDKRPAEHKWWTDGLFTVLSAMIPFLIILLIIIIVKNNPGILGAKKQEIIKIHPVSTE